MSEGSQEKFGQVMMLGGDANSDLSLLDILDHVLNAGIVRTTRGRCSDRDDFLLMALLAQHTLHAFCKRNVVND